MDYIAIIDNLKKNGYDGHLQENLGIVFCSILDDEGEPKIGTISQIEIINDQFLFRYFDRNVPIEKLFNSIDELIVFLKDLYPLEN